MQLTDRTYAGVRGFNYVPSYAATIWDTIDHFDAEVWDREFGYSKRFGASSLRIWTDFLSFQRDEEGFLEKWRQAFDLAEKHDLSVMVTLANRWVDDDWPIGQLDYSSLLAGAPTAQYRHYLTSFVEAFRTDSRILMWDLCNEPFVPVVVPPPTSIEPDLSISETRKQAEYEFWRGCAETIRAADASQPITIGLHPDKRLVPPAMHEVVDVLSCHPYGGWWDGGAEFASYCDTFAELANDLGKPLVCSETTQGSADNAVRTEILNVSLRELEQRGIGWFAWHLMAGKIVSARWDRTDINCRPGDRAVMYFVEADGSTRPGHEMSEWRDW